MKLWRRVAVLSILLSATAPSAHARPADGVVITVERSQTRAELVAKARKGSDHSILRLAVVVPPESPTVSLSMNYTAQKGEQSIQYKYSVDISELFYFTKSSRAGTGYDPTADVKLSTLRMDDPERAWEPPLCVDAPADSVRQIPRHFECGAGTQGWQHESPTRAAFAVNLEARPDFSDPLLSPSSAGPQVHHRKSLARPVAIETTVQALEKEHEKGAAPIFRAAGDSGFRFAWPHEYHIGSVPDQPVCQFADGTHRHGGFNCFQSSRDLYPMRVSLERPSTGIVQWT